MIRRTAFAAVALLVLALCGAAPAQDVQGIELCTRETQMDRRTSCLQSNIQYLHGLVAKNAADGQHKLNAAAGEIGALKGEVAALKNEIATLKAALAAAHASLEKLQAAARHAVPPPEKPGAK